MAATKKQARKAKEQDPKHDEGYKDILSNRTMFFHFLKKYFATASWTANISPKDLELVKGSFITKEYEHLDSDLIYKLKMGGKDVYFYVLMELQSRVDFTMPFRLLCYMVELLSVIFKNTAVDIRTRKDFRLPAIVPIVLYNGRDKWTAAVRYRDYTRDGRIFGDQVIDFRYLMFDLNKTAEEAIEPVEDPLDAVFVVEKLRLGKKLGVDSLLNWWTENVSGFSKGHKDLLVNWLNQSYFGGKMSPEMKQALKNNSKKGGVIMKSLVDEWVEQWKLEGERKGVSKGKKQGVLEVARSLKTLGRMSVKEIAQATKLPVNDIIRL